MKWLVNFLTLYLLFLNPVSNIVLCWGEEGHFSIESIEDTHICCGEFESNEMTRSAESIYQKDLSKDSECLHCLDFFILVQTDVDTTAPPVKVTGKHASLSGFVLPKAFIIQTSHSNNLFSNVSYSLPCHLNSIKFIQLLI